jgi:hypothetical protein
MAKNPLDPFALNIGRLCNEWQDLEFGIEMIFSLVAGIPRGPERTMVHCLDVRDLMVAIRIGVIATATPRTTPWANEVVFAMNYIDNTLRPRRNRYVHDSLWHGHWGIMRRGRQPKSHRSQAHGPLSVRQDVRVESIADLRATLRATRDAAEWLWQLEFTRRRLDTHPDEPPDHIEELRPRLLLQAPTGTPPPGST